jgi:hypothetical protein
VSRPAIATVTVLTLPHISPDATRVEIECRYSTTGLTSIPGPFALPVPALITAAVFEHESRCGECDTSEAHAEGNRALRQETERVYAAVQQRRQRRYADGRRN